MEHETTARRPLAGFAVTAGEFSETSCAAHSSKRKENQHELHAADAVFQTGARTRAEAASGSSRHGKILDQTAAGCGFPRAAQRSEGARKSVSRTGSGAATWQRGRRCGGLF